MRGERRALDSGDEPLLTERERTILRLIAAGSTNGEIAELLYVEPSTVKWHIKHLYSKLEARDRVQLVLRAQSLQLT